ncbi:hypothetical protein EJF87_12715, partial [Neisseria meningitidis]|nr:hypothetical protein [Neisseria meningitidis]
LNGLDSRFCGNDGDRVAVIVDEQKPVRRCLALVRRERFSKGAEAPSESVPYYLYCLRLRRLVLIFVNSLYRHRQTKLRHRRFVFV